MSRAQVEEILGPATSEDSVIDVQTLYYRTDSRATTPLSGSVTLTGDRVTAAAPRAF